MDDGIPMNFTTFADVETWFELIGTTGQTFSYMQAPNYAKGMMKRRWRAGLCRHVSTSDVK